MALLPTPLLGFGCPFLAVEPPPGGRAVGLVSVASGLTTPLKLVAPPDGSGRLFIVDQIGLVRWIDAGGALSPAPFLDLRNALPALSPFYDERGLLGMAFHPDYAANRRFFVCYNAPKGGDIPATFDCELRVSEFLARSDDPNLADPDSERVLLRIGKPQANHNAGDLAFGPDGMLYVSVGDGGGANDADAGHTPGLGNAQDTSVLLGKILRIDVNSGDPYAIPPDNPFVGQSSARGEIWAAGFRNPYRFSFDRAGARRLFVADVGQNLYEEVNIVTAGANYGWRIREGTHCFDLAHSSSPPVNCPATSPDGAALTPPILEYLHANPGGPRGIAAVGGHVYRGSALASLAGNYLFGDFSRGFISPDGSLFAATEDADGVWTMTELSIAGGVGGRLGHYVTGFGEDALGELYLLTTDSLGTAGTSGRVFRVVPP